MTDEAKQVITRRLTQCNRGELVVIMYDIFFAHLADVRIAFEKHDSSEFADSLRQANQVLERLIKDLDFKYDISKALYRLYVYAREELSKAMYENRLERVEQVEILLRRPYDSFCEAARMDTSGPMMSNTQQVYAGMTYGRSNVNENLIDGNNQRGFLV